MANKKSFSSKITEEDPLPETEVSKEFLNLLVDELKHIYWIEKHLTKALPKMHKAGFGEALKGALAGHLATTQIQVERLEQIFETLGEPPRAKKCDAMSELVEEANAVIEASEKGTRFRDTGLLLAAQKIELYEIATYGGLIQLARTLGNEDIISLLEETLSEEKEAVELLTSLAEGSHNESGGQDAKKKSTDGDEEIVEVYDSINLTRKNNKK